MGGQRISLRSISISALLARQPGRARTAAAVDGILDRYEVDGFNNDTGYLSLANNPRPPASDEVSAFSERPGNDGALTDLLALIYAEVKRRGGLMKLHIGGAMRPQTDQKSMTIFGWAKAAAAATNCARRRKAFRPTSPPAST
jgi:hypothetical protein